MPEDGRRAARLLVVEDDPTGQKLLLEALRAGPVPKEISVARDGIEAMAFLRREGVNAGAPRPDLILMPVRAPLQGGHRMIAEIKSDPQLKRIPILVLTSSRSGGDVDRAYDWVNCYIVKPVEMDRFFAMVRAIEEFWLTVVILPPS